MIIDNTCTEVGDVLLFSLSQPILGALSITYTDTIIGETATRYFDKKFRYSFDGISYTDWTELSNINLALIPLSATTTIELVFDFMYTRVGSDITGALQFDGMIFNGTSFPFEQNAEVALNSIFKDIFFNNIDIYELTINLTQKLFESGIVPEYIVRNEKANDLENDKDYIALFKTISNFFSLFFVFAQQYSNIYHERELLTELVKQKGLKFCKYQQIYDLQLLMGRFYSEIRKRGTIIPFLKKNTVLADSSVIDIDGEFLRMICYDVQIHEYLFNLVKQELGGWTVQKSSPLFRGLTIHDQVNKSWENTQNFVDLSKFEIVTPTTGIPPSPGWAEIITDGSKEVLRLVTENNESCGIFVDSGLVGSITEENYIIVDPTLSYEFTFWWRQPLNQVPIFNASLWGFDQYNNQVDFMRNSDFGADNRFFVKTRPQRTDKYIFVRLVLNSFQTTMNYKPELDAIDGGQSLQFSDLKITRLKLNLHTSALLQNWIYLWDLKVRPIKTPWSTGFVRLKNFAEIWYNNNSGRESNDDVENFVRRYQLPYDCTFKTIRLPENQNYF